MVHTFTDIIPGLQRKRGSIPARVETMGKIELIRDYLYQIGSCSEKWWQELLFNISHSIYQVFLYNIINLHTAVWFQMSNTNIPKSIIEQFYLTNRWDPLQV